MRFIYDTLAWILAILLMALWIVLAALCCLLCLPLTAGAWLRGRAHWEAVAAVLLLAILVVAVLTYRPAPPVQWVRPGFLHPAPTWPEIGTVRRVF